MSTTKNIQSMKDRALPKRSKLRPTFFLGAHRVDATYQINGCSEPPSKSTRNVRRLKEDAE